MEPDLRQFYMDLEMRSGSIQSTPGVLLRAVKNDIELVGERKPLASNDLLPLCAQKSFLGFLKWTQIGFPKDRSFSATPVIHS